LPVHRWHNLTNDEKRRRGISNCSGVSIIRANREIDYGWFFMGTKRRENYDDWWRCEICFDPILDEAFGVTHTKQQIKPQEYLNEILVPDIEAMAKALNARVRQTHILVKASERSQYAEQIAIERENLLKPLPKYVVQDEYDAVFKQVIEQHKGLQTDISKSNDGELKYCIREAKMKQMSFYCFAVKNGHFILVINPEHPFYKKVYEPLGDESKPGGKELRCFLDLMLLSAARSEVQAIKKSDREVLRTFRNNWSDTLATFFSK